MLLKYLVQVKNIHSVARLAKVIRGLLHLDSAKLVAILKLEPAIVYIGSRVEGLWIASSIGTLGDCSVELFEQKF